LLLKHLKLKINKILTQDQGKCSPLTIFIPNIFRINLIFLLENYLETNEFLQNLFSNFPNWITNWEINQVSNGGKAPAKDASLNELNSHIMRKKLEFSSNL